jgi:tetratricopeptide (TPR) repeat protein
MNHLYRIWLSILILLLGSTPGWAQGGGSGGGDTMGSALRTLETNIWRVFGRVTTVRGNPLGDASVRVDIGTGINSVRVVKTNLQGEFQTEWNLEAGTTTRLNVTLVASKSGYADARETAEFGAKDTTRGIDLVLRESSEDPDQLTMPALIDSLVPRLREDAAKQSGVEPRRKEFVQGCDELINRHNAVRAVPLLSRVVERAPNCVECRLLLSLALLGAGSSGGATRQLDEAMKLNDAAAVKRPEPPLIAGVLDAWRGETGTAAGFFQKALEIDPNQTLGHQEMGRVLAAQKNWEAADQHLEKAIRAGAPDSVRLLRVHVLLEEGDLAEAGREIDAYVAGRDIKTLSLESRALYLQVQDRLSAAAPRGKVKSVLTQSPEDLLEAMPELKGMQVASGQDELEVVLKKTGQGVELFFKNFPNTVSVEQVHQERLGKDGRIKDSRDQEFQYLLLAQAEKWGLGIEEQRTTPRGDRTGLGGLNQGLMLTSGFASASLVFHPAYQDGASFRYLGRQSLDGRDLHVVAFAQRPETARMAERFIADGTSAVVWFQGLAWIDPTTFQIVRLRSDLLTPQAKVRLQRQTTEIQFMQVAFKQVAVALWLPQQVTVTVDWRGRTLRNLHRYSDFRVFNVATEEHRKTTLPPPPAPDKPN